MNVKDAFDTLNRDQFKAGRFADREVTPSERSYALIMHLGTLLAVNTGLMLVVPLIMWLIKKDESPFIDDHGKETVNFHITLVVYALASWLLAFLTCGVGIVAFIPLYLYGLIFTIVAAVAANKGEYYRYPACLRFVH